MIRLSSRPRENWQELIKDQGLTFNESGDGKFYWNDDAYYLFSSREIDVIETATQELHDMCENAVDDIISSGSWYERLGIPVHAIPMIEESWKEAHPSLYGRFDLSYDGTTSPKMLEYNADTPTSLLEGSVIQWYWKEDCEGDKDQFNNLHDALVERFKLIKNLGHKHFPLHFAHIDNPEDEMNIAYLRSAAQEAGLETNALFVEEIGWNPDTEDFRDLEDNPIKNLFKLYPWEWIWNEEFGKNVIKAKDKTLWTEPAWKLILSNKAIMAYLWEKNQNHPNLLPTYLEGPKDLHSYVKKPFFSREGSNIEIYDGKNTMTVQGIYGKEGHIYQKFAPLPKMGNYHPVIGSWIIGNQAKGMGIRESDSLITTNISRFVPHAFV